MVHNSDRFGEEYVKDFQASERKGLQALSASVGSYQTVARNDRIVLNTWIIDNHPSILTMTSAFYTIDVVFTGDGTNIVDGGDRNVSIKAHKRGWRELLLILRHL